MRELRALASSGTVLDAPCGDGSLAARIGDAGFDVIGLDIDAPSRGSALDFRQTDLGDALPVVDGEADFVVSVEGIEHLERPFEFVRECRRVLKTEGRLIITTPNISSLRSRWRWFLTGFHNKCKHALDETDPNPMHHINMLSYPEMRYMLHTNGFVIEKITTNRQKLVSWLYAPLVPLVYVVSRLVIAAEKPRRFNKRISLEVLSEMLKPELLFGELMIIVARRADSGEVVAAVRP